MIKPGVKWRTARSYLFSNISFRQTLAKNAFWLTFGNIVGRAARAAFIIYVARILGAEGYGIFSYALSLAALFSLFSDIGISGILTREAARDPEAVPVYASTTLVIKTVLLLLAAGVILAIAPIFAKIPGVIPLLPLAALLIIFDGLRDLTFSVTRAKEKMEIEAWIGMATNIAIAGVGIVAVWLRPDPRVLMLSYTLGSGAGMALAYALLWRHFAGFWKKFRMKLVRPILAEGMPFALMSLLATLLTSIDTLALGYLGTAEDVGLYSAALRPIQLLYLIPSITATIIFPTFARLAAEKSASFQRVLERSLAFSLLIALPIAAGGSLLAKDIINLLFGAPYAEAALPFAILLWTVLFTFTYSFIGNAIFAFGKQKNFVIYLGIGALTNIVLILLLTPRFGIAGPAIATVVAQIVANFLIWRRLRSFQKFTVLPHLGPTLAATAVMAALVAGLRFAGAPVILNIVLSAGCYFGLLALFKEKLLDYLKVSKLRVP